MGLVKTRSYELPFIITVTTTNSRQGGDGLAGLGKETWLVNFLDDRRRHCHFNFCCSGRRVLFKAVLDLFTQSTEIQRHVEYDSLQKEKEKMLHLKNVLL